MAWATGSLASLYVEDNGFHARAVCRMLRSGRWTDALYYARCIYIYYVVLTPRFLMLYLRTIQVNEVFDEIADDDDPSIASMEGKQDYTCAT